MSEKRMFVLDTDVVSELRKIGEGKADVRVITWIAEQDNVAEFEATGVGLINPWVGT